jgi:DNA-binding HxlR family transcriptional regulator
MAYQPKRPALDPCPVEEVVGMVGGKWKARLLLILSFGPIAFAPLRRSLPGISQQVLSTQLQALMDDGLVAREASGADGGGSLYSLTATGLDLMPVLNAVAAWGETRLRERGEKWVRPVALESAG